MPRAAAASAIAAISALGDQRAGRIARRIDDDRLGARRDRIDDRRGLDREAVLHVRLHDHRRGVGELDLIADARPERAVRDHLVAGLEERHRGVVERLLGAGGDDDFLGLDLDAVVEAIALRRRRRAARGRRPTACTSVKFASSAACAASLTCSGVGEVGLAGAQIDDVDALAAQTIGFGGDLQRRVTPSPGSCAMRNSFRLSSAFCSSWPSACASCSSTTGGTRPVTSPPSVNTSLISRELM